MKNCYIQQAGELYSGGITDRLLKYEMKGCHFLMKRSLDPLSAYLIFSRLKKNITSFSQADWDGELGDFHANRILRRVKVVKAIISLSLVWYWVSMGGTPKIARRGHDCTFIPNTLVSVSKHSAKNLQVGGKTCAIDLLLDDHNGHILNHDL